jgi:predicted ribosome quality control (RQC) complex YloA/Tae2 family protein
MPFDSLVLRQLAAGWKTSLIGSRWTQADSEPGRVRLSGRSGDLLIVLVPGLARIHRASPQGRKARKRGASQRGFFDRLLPFTVVDIQVVPWERIVHFGVTQDGDLGEVFQRTLVVELAGHQANIILIDSDGLVVDAFKRVPVSAPGRTVFPGQPYTPPAPLLNPCQTHEERDLPPWAQKRLREVGPDFWPRLCEDYRNNSFALYRLDHPGGPEVWVYPRNGYRPSLALDPDEMVAEVFAEKEERLRRDGQKHQYLERLRDQVSHWQDRLNEWQAWTTDDGERDRELGDLWLAYQTQFLGANPPTQLTVDSFRQPGTSICLQLNDGSTPQEMAAEAYRRYKKAKSRQDVAKRLVQQAEFSLRSAQAELALIESDQLSPDQIAQRLLESSSNNRRGEIDLGEKTPYRRFTSQHGIPIFVGRNREENAALTFRQARPDDLWFHAKQSPGSHVILASGKTDPPLEDLLDAAELAVFYSTAQHSSMVPVDYTRRKMVKKRPHSEPGQVLYRQEKTLYITPSAERLKRLGAIKERLGDE